MLLALLLLFTFLCLQGSGCCSRQLPLDGGRSAVCSDSSSVWSARPATDAAVHCPAVATACWAGSWADVEASGVAAAADVSGVISAQHRSFLEISSVKIKAGVHAGINAVGLTACMVACDRGCCGALLI